MGGVDAIKEVEFSIIQNRGCFGNCNFCAITFHQGRQVVSRSEQSILHEAEEMTHNPHFKGYIHDVGGPTADFRYPSCKKQLKYGLCQNRKCLAPKPCPQLEIDHMEYVELLRSCAASKGSKRCLSARASATTTSTPTPIPPFCRSWSNTTSAVSSRWLPSTVSIMFWTRWASRTSRTSTASASASMRKPSASAGAVSGALPDVLPPRLHHRRCGGAGSLPQAPPYAPGTSAGLLPHTRHQLHLYVLHRSGPADDGAGLCSKTAEEKFYQRTLLQYYKPENRHNVIQALIRAHREDLIGNGPNCLVAPDNEYIRTHTRRPAASSGNAPAPQAQRHRSQAAQTGQPPRALWSTAAVC